MTATTTICIDLSVKSKLDDLKVYKNEPYNSVVERLIKMAYDEEPLTEEEIKGIEESLEDIKAGRAYSEKEAKRMLGLED
jgi:predicted transcriptional regulator